MGCFQSIVLDPLVGIKAASRRLFIRSLRSARLDQNHTISWLCRDYFGQDSVRGSQRLIKISNTYLLPLASLKTSGHASDIRPGEDCFCGSWTALLGVGGVRAHLSCFGQGCWLISWLTRTTRQPLARNFTRIIEQRFGAVIRLLLLGGKKQMAFV